MRVQEHLEIGYLIGRIQNGAIPALLASVVTTLVWGIFGFGWLDLTIGLFCLLVIPVVVMSALNVWMSYRRFFAAEEAWAVALGDLLSLGLRLNGALDVSGRSKKPKEMRERMILRIAAVVHALRGELRGVHSQDDLADLLNDDEFQETRGALQSSIHLMDVTRTDIRSALADERMTTIDATSLLNTLDQVVKDVHFCRSLMTTHAPPVVTLGVPLINIGFCVLLPLGLVTTMGWLTPVATVLTSIVFLLPDAISSSLSNPFGAHPDCLPLYRDSRAFETTLRGVLGQDALPRSIEPFGGVIR